MQSEGLQNEREIELLDLIYYVLARWKRLILAGVIGLLLVGGYKFYSAEQAEEADPTEQTSYQEAREKLSEKEEELLILKGQRAVLQTRRDNFSMTEKGQELAREKAGQLQNYLSESVLMNINAGAAPKAAATYQVSLTSPLSPDETYAGEPVDALLAAYGEDIVLPEETLTKYSVPAKYLQELISVTVDETADTVTVTAYGEDLEMAESLLADACTVLEERQEEIKDRYRVHDLVKTAEICGETVDSGLAARQSQKYEEMKAYTGQANGESVTANLYNSDSSTGIAALAAEMSAEELDAAIAIFDRDIEDAEVEVTQAETAQAAAAENAKALTAKSGIKKGIKFGIIGGVVFAVLLAGVYCLIYVFDGKLHTVDELGFCYGMPLLAALSAPFGKGCGLDKVFYRLRNKGAGTSNEVVLQTAAVTISKLLGGAKTAAVITSLDEEALEPVSSALAKFIPDVQFVAVADTNLTAEAAEKLKAVDAVIVYEKREASRIREIEAELHQARLMEKNIVGCIVG